MAKSFTALKNARQDRSPNGGVSMIRSVLEVESFLQNLPTKSSKVTGKNITLERMWPLLRKVGSPQRTLRVIHVAGTSGKTSTATYISSLLTARGATVGLTISPHIHSVTERLQLNGSQLDEKQFCELFNSFVKLLPQNTDATYFEYMIVFVLWAFKELSVDYAVLETGLGGLFDGTNVCQNPDKICVITDIGMDHQQILGNSIKEIATQKAGIVHTQNEVFLYTQQQEVMDCVNNRAKIVGATVHEILPEVVLQNKSLPKFQHRNWMLAKHVADFIANRDALTNITRAQEYTTQKAVLGRMQQVNYRQTEFIIDGAHNEQKMQTFIDSYTERYGREKVPIILAMKEGKDFEAVIALLKPLSKILLCTGYDVQQDMPIKSLPSQLLITAAHQIGVEAEAFDSIYDALVKVIDKEEPRVIVTGSLYVIGAVLDYLN
ncbi:MAG TPA: Mur ligase family protein [Candidatus Saccharibacteria bacterium]|jgi:dihydrofolate synthase/folylpolyglutamate synthase|nr:Mur ligase family protein [Candidatus Saccharibacteria bacterium]